MVYYKACVFVSFSTFIVILFALAKETVHQLSKGPTTEEVTSPRFVKMGEGTEKNRSLLLSVFRQGRLGNAMWQYSALYGLAHLTNRMAILNPGFRDLHQIFTLSASLENKMDRLKSFHLFRYRDGIDSPDVEGIATKLRNTSRSVMLRGYFQYAGFFSYVSGELRKEFTFRKKIKEKVNAFFEHLELADRKVVKVGVHIRRGDLSKPHWIRMGFGPPDASYFLNAMEYFRSKFRRVHFIVCSDDMNWVHKYIKGDDITYVSKHPAAMDMAILASCDHVIVSNGTFSWWIGWLCKGTTVRYKGIPRYNTRVYNMTLGEYWPPEDEYNHYIAIDSR